MKVTKRKRPTMADPSMALPVAEKAIDLFALSCFRSKTTGVDGTVIWVSCGEFGGGDFRHGPRIKVVLGDHIKTEGLQDAVSVRLTSPPEVLGKLPGKVSRQAVEFVSRNRSVLLRHWAGEIDTKEMSDLLERV